MIVMRMKLSSLFAASLLGGILASSLLGCDVEASLGAFMRADNVATDAGAQNAPGPEAAEAGAQPFDEPSIDASHPTFSGLDAGLRQTLDAHVPGQDAGPAPTSKDAGHDVPLACQAPSGTCESCLADSCCVELAACRTQTACSCALDCLLDGHSLDACRTQCALSAGSTQETLLSEVSHCAQANCADCPF